MKTSHILLGVLVTFAALPARAQTNNAINDMGVVESIDAASISVKKDAGGAVEKFKLAPNLMVLQNKTITLAEIKPNDFVAILARENVQLASYQRRRCDAIANRNNCPSSGR